MLIFVEHHGFSNREDVARMEECQAPNTGTRESIDSSTELTGGASLSTQFLLIVYINAFPTWEHEVLISNSICLFLAAKTRSSVNCSNLS